MDSASCAQADPEAFFPEVGQSTGSARRVCAGCPVIRECEAHASHLEGDVSKALRHGTWAARSPQARARNAKEAA